jgi:hypothetical protein
MPSTTSALPLTELYKVIDYLLEEVQKNNDPTMYLLLQLCKALSRSSLDKISFHLQAFDDTQKLV